MRSKLVQLISLREQVSVDRTPDRIDFVCRITVGQSSQLIDLISL